MARPQVHAPAGQLADPESVVAVVLDQDTLASRPALASSVLTPRLSPTVTATETEYASESDREHPFDSARHDTDDRYTGPSTTP